MHSSKDTLCPCYIAFLDERVLVLSDLAVLKVLKAYLSSLLLMWNRSVSFVLFSCFWSVFTILLLLVLIYDYSVQSAHGLLSYPNFRFEGLNIRHIIFLKMLDHLWNIHDMPLVPGGYSSYLLDWFQKLSRGLHLLVFLGVEVWETLMPWFVILLHVFFEEWCLTGLFRAPLS